MPLPILQTSNDLTPSDLVRLFHRTELHWVRHVGEEAQLDAGTAFTNPLLSNVPNANGMLDATLPEGVAPEAASETNTEPNRFGTVEPPAGNITFRKVELEETPHVKFGFPDRKLVDLQDESQNIGILLTTEAAGGILRHRDTDPFE